MVGARRAAFVLLVVAGCAGGLPAGPTATGLPGSRPSPTTMTDGTVRYVALGDSYTIGTSVGGAERWPDQLVVRLRERVPLELVANLAVNGYTTRDVIDVELPKLDAHRPELVSLLIGVNDVVQGVPEATFRANLARILDELGVRVGPTRIVVVAVPDYTVTPAGADYGDPATQSAGIRRVNELLAELARARAIAFVDIYGISLAAADDRSLVASDGLHPSGAQYARWVDEIAPAVEDLLAP